MRISDWSSDVCSSDLAGRSPQTEYQANRHCGTAASGRRFRIRAPTLPAEGAAPICEWRHSASQKNIEHGRGRVDRKSVVWGKSGAEMEDHGGGRFLYKQRHIR